MVLSVRRLGVLLALLCASLALAGTAAAGPADARTGIAEADALEAKTIIAINVLRREHGLRTVRFSPQLMASAAAHAIAMGEEGFFAHESADGSEFWQRIARFYPTKGFERWTVGENLLWGSPTVTPEKAVDLWLDSPSHRRILLNPAWTEIGLAAVRVTNAPGVFDGLEVTILTADFGVRA